VSCRSCKKSIGRQRPAVQYVAGMFAQERGELPVGQVDRFAAVGEAPSYGVELERAEAVERARGGHDGTAILPGTTTRTGCRGEETVTIEVSDAQPVLQESPPLLPEPPPALSAGQQVLLDRLQAVVDARLDLADMPQAGRDPR
jgi:hypothetical protein